MTTSTVEAFDAAAHFDLIWTAQAGGFDKAHLETRLDEYRVMSAALEAGRITPAKIIGSGYKKPKTLARAWLAQQINELERDLATQGRTNSVNIANVRHAAPSGHPLKDHLPAWKRDDKYGHLFKLTCSCGFAECGYSAITSHTPSDFERHLADAIR